MYKVLKVQLDRDECLASSPSRFSPPGTYLDRRLGGPQSRSGRGAEEKINLLLLVIFILVSLFE